MNDKSKSEGLIQKVMEVVHEGAKVHSQDHSIENSERIYSTIIDALSEGVVFQLADGTIRASNKSAEDILGLTAEQMMGRTSLDPLWKSIHEDGSDFPGETHPIIHTLKTGETRSNVIMGIHHPDETLKWISINTTPLFRNNEKNPYGAIALFRDITQQKLSEQQLINKDLTERQILNNMIDAVITIDELGNCASFNNAAEKLFGYSTADIIGRNIKCLMVQPDSVNHDRYLSNFISSGHAKIIGKPREVTGLRKDKTTFPFRLSVSEIYLDNSKRYFIGTCHDLTHAHEQEEKVRLSQKMNALGKLTGGLAHDYNNMLAVIMGYTSLLKLSLTNQPKLQNYAKQIDLAAQRGVKLTKKMLRFTQTNPVSADQVNLNSLLEEQSDMLQTLLTYRVTLVLELEDNTWEIAVDKSELVDAVLNLSINAMHAMEDNISNSKLIIRSRNTTILQKDAELLNLQSGDYVQLSFIDTGCGMDDLTKERIFEPFFTTKKDKGTGLGLSQLFGFIKRSSGSIKIDSKPDVGSQFILYFPRNLTSSKNKISQNNVDIDELNGDETILLVDDEEALLSLTSLMLTERGYKVLSANSSSTALKILKDKDINLLLTDIIMPEMDGYQLATICKELYPTTKIQLCSGYTESPNKSLVTSSLHQNILNKPYTELDLLKCIRNLLDDNQ